MDGYCIFGNPRDRSSHLFALFRGRPRGYEIMRCQPLPFLLPICHSKSEFSSWRLAENELSHAHILTDKQTKTRHTWRGGGDINVIVHARACVRVRVRPLLHLQIDGKEGQIGRGGEGHCVRVARFKAVHINLWKGLRDSPSWLAPRNPSHTCIFPLLSLLLFSRSGRGRPRPV